VPDCPERAIGFPARPRPGRAIARRAPHRVPNPFRIARFPRFLPIAARPGRGTDLAIVPLEDGAPGGAASGGARERDPARRDEETMERRGLWQWLIGRLARPAVETAPSPAPRHVDPRNLAEWEGRIVASGVSREQAVRLAPLLASAQRELGRGSTPALIRGGALALAMLGEGQAQAERSLRDVREVERLLGAFTGELEKLDEVLEVLSAYAQRMRPQKPGGNPRRLLH